MSWPARLSILGALAILGVYSPPEMMYSGVMAKSPETGRGSVCLHPIGTVKRRGERVYLAILPEFAPALKGIEDLSHLWVLYWFHENDRPEARRTLQVHPRRDPANPLTGVFACRAPERPNLIGFTACRLLQVQDNLLEVANLDARDGSPILDLKPYIPEGDAIAEAVIPAWVKRPRPKK